MLRRPLGDVAVRLFGDVAKPCRAWNILVRSFIITACAGEIISLFLLEEIGQHTVSMSYSEAFYSLKAP